MKPVDEHPEIRRTLRTLRIIVIALCLGLGIFLAVIWLKVLPAKAAQDDARPTPEYVQVEPGGRTDGNEVLVFMALGALGLLIPVWLVVRAIQLRKAREAYTRGGAQAFHQAYSSAVIVLAALLEGVGFFGAVAWMLTAEPLALGVAGVCLLGMILQIPSEARVNTLLEDLP